MRKEFLLVFPPITEARLFPYLSLPMITAYLRTHGVDIRQRDFNIELCHRLFTKEALLRYLELFPSPQTLQEQYRCEMARFLLSHQSRLSRHVFEKECGSKKEAHRDVRFVRQGIELLLEGSLLKRDFLSLEQIGEFVEQFDQLDPSDIAANLQYTLLRDAIEVERPKVFALSVAYYSQLMPSLLLAKWVKNLLPDCQVFMGGQQIMLRYESLVEIPGFRKYVDGLGIAAGEETMLKLSHYLKGKVTKEEVPDALWLDKDGDCRGPRSRFHLMDAPPPDFSDLPYQNYLMEEVNLSIITCVGCYWGRCAFCSYGNRSRQEKNYQQKTPVQIADECQWLVDTYGEKRINFVDENTNLRVVLRAMRILNERGYQISFSTRNRFEEILLDKDFCRELRQRGCVLMSVGYETISQRLLDLLDKGVQAKHYQKIIDNLHEVNLPLRLSIMGGIADETFEEVKESEEFLLRNADKIGIDVMQMLVAEPKTYLSQHPEKYRIQLKEGDGLRGNKLLNYGMGRMGFDFTYSDGDTFDPRLQRFIHIYDRVKPLKNDELPPEKRRKKERNDELEPPLELHLYPWVRVLEAPVKNQEGNHRYLADLLWQNVVRLAPFMEVEGSVLKVADSQDGRVSQLLVQLAEKGFGKRPKKEVGV
ncbi:B12-binding domain-containing radical SAM protein [Salinithrix halophila]|uniref:B12-binding domain-containing radical SAM protein n=1 Tax=Salinithrix halophila TaxID=1485204 RepID=A0ABV8JF42_9BACL